MVDHSSSDWFLEGCGHRFKLRCPRYIAGILSQILTGWALTRADEALIQYQISVAFSDNGYFVDSIVLNKAEAHTDLRNAINELIVNLAYLVSSGNKNFRLLHCAAFVEDKKMNVIVGKKTEGSLHLFTVRHLKALKLSLTICLFGSASLASSTHWDCLSDYGDQF